MKLEIRFPVFDKKKIESLKAGDEVAVSGTIYTLRDAAHKRLVGEIEMSGKVPEFLVGSCIFYAGPAMTSTGKLVAIGPTTSKRMDRYAPLLYEKGVVATIGKGPRSREISYSCKKNKSIYLISFGGAASYLVQFVKKIKPFAYRELGPEAIYKLELERMPCIVGIDAHGNVFPEFKGVELV